MLPPPAWAGGNAATWLKRWVFTDHLGGAVLYTDEVGNVVQRRVFEPFGEVVAESTVTEVTLRQFTDQPYEAETGLYDYDARWYDAEAGRFLAADPVMRSIAAPQSLNAYSYVENNPVNRVDPTGLVGFGASSTSVLDLSMGSPRAEANQRQGRGGFRGSGFVTTYENPSPVQIGSEAARLQDLGWGKIVLGVVVAAVGTAFLGPIGLGAGVALIVSGAQDLAESGSVAAAGGLGSASLAGVGSLGQLSGLAGLGALGDSDFSGLSDVASRGGNVQLAGGSRHTPFGRLLRQQELGRRIDAELGEFNRRIRLGGLIALERGTTLAINVLSGIEFIVDLNDSVHDGLAPAGAENPFTTSPFTNTRRMLEFGVRPELRQRIGDLRLRSPGRILVPRQRP